MANTRQTTTRSTLLHILFFYSLYCFVFVCYCSVFVCFFFLFCFLFFVFCFFLFFFCCFLFFFLFLLFFFFVFCFFFLFFPENSSKFIQKISVLAERSLARSRINSPKTQKKVMKR